MVTQVVEPVVEIVYVYLQISEGDIEAPNQNKPLGRLLQVNQSVVLVSLQVVFLKVATTILKRNLWSEQWTRKMFWKV